MTRKFDAWAKAARRDVLSRCTPSTRRCSATRCYKSIFDVPGDIDLAIILTGQAVDTFEEVLQRKAKFAVIFAAGFSETGTEGEKLERRLDGARARAATCACSARTRTSTRSRTSATTSTARRSRSITQSGHQGRPVFQGQELGIRLTHWAPTGNEVDLEFADFARYFADQPEVGVIACYIEGFKDGRTLMLAADHAAQLRKPIVMVKVGKTDGRRSRWRSRHTGHLTGSDAVTSRGVPPVRRHARRRPRRAARGLGRARPHPARRASRRGRSRQRQPGVCVYAISGGTGAHMADLLADAGLRAPRPHEGDAEGAARRADPRVPARVEPGRLRRPAGRRRARPQDPRRDPRRQERRHRRRPDHRRGRDVQRAVHARPHRGRARRPTKPIFVVWGAPAGTDDTYYKRLLDGGLPVFRTFDNCVDGGEGLRRLLDVRGALPLAVRRPRRPTPLAGGEEGAQAARRARSPARRCRSGSSKQLLAGVRHQDVEGRAVQLGRRGGAGRERDRLSRS